MKRRRVWIGAGVIAAVAVWGLFRPELLLIDRRVNEAFPGGSAREEGFKTLRSGEFLSVAHETRGRATIHQLAGGKRVLRLSEFMTSNGPDVRVLLVAAEEAGDDLAVRNGSPIELGKLKGNIGDQNYELPADVDLDKYKSVSIWCKRFGVNFGSARLM